MFYSNIGKLAAGGKHSIPASCYLLILGELRRIWALIHSHDFFTVRRLVGAGGGGGVTRSCCVWLSLLLWGGRRFSYCLAFLSTWRGSLRIFTCIERDCQQQSVLVSIELNIKRDSGFLWPASNVGSRSPPVSSMTISFRACSRAQKAGTLPCRLLGEHRADFHWVSHI